MTQAFTIFTIVVANIGTVLLLFLHSDKKLNEYRDSFDRKLEEMRKDTNAILLAIQTEMKDFHGRLCAIEEKNKKS